MDECADAPALESGAEHVDVLGEVLRCASCPSVVNRLQTLDGEAVWQCVQSSGVWQRAGLEGQITGLDVGAVEARLRLGGGGHVSPALQHLVEQVEQGALRGLAKKREVSDGA
ncbi:MAG: hypothetical protein P1U84_12195 [Parvibaculaceae bacterium]|nr:hypothetical protein [Parvibaculaceae bacterium]